MIRLQSATYPVRDLDEAIRFFVDAVGFTAWQDVDLGGGRRRVVVGAADGGTGLVLSPTAADQVRLRAGGGVAFFLETDDFTAQHARMVAAGVRFREEPRHEAWGTVAVFEDPGGIAWDLIQPPG